MGDPEIFIHEKAVVDAGAKIGTGTKVWHFSHICGKQVEIGVDCSFGQNTYVGNDVKIGRGCRIQNNVSIYDRVELGDYVFCGPSVVFTNVMNPRAHVPRKNEFKTTKIRAGVSLGANSTIVCGIEIGRFAFVAAGAVVTKNVAPFSLVVGIPAKHTGWICHCGVQLASNTCSSCGSEYKVTAEACSPISLKNCFEEK